MTPTVLEQIQPGEIPVFGGLRADALNSLLADATIRRLPGGAVLFERASLPGEFFVVLSGAVAICCEDGTIERRVGPNGAVGLLSMIDFQPRARAARAEGVTSVLVVSAASLDQFYRRDPRAYALLVLNFARELARMLRAYSGG